MLSAGFEFVTLAIERLQTYALDSLRSKNLPSKFHAHLRLGTLFSLLLNGMWDAFIICRMTRLSLNHYSY